MDNLHISAISPLGYTVICTNEQWDSITSPDGHGHGDMINKEINVINAISNPQIIFNSVSPIGRHIYYSRPEIIKSGKNAYTKVVVARPQSYNNFAFIITTHREQRLGANKGAIIYEAN